MTRLLQIEYPEHHAFLNVWRFSASRWLVISGGSDVFYTVAEPDPEPEMNSTEFSLE